jgi:hypothetical protein
MMQILNEGPGFVIATSAAATPMRGRRALDLDAGPRHSLGFLALLEALEARLLLLDREGPAQARAEDRCFVSASVSVTYREQDATLPRPIFALARTLALLLERSEVSREASYELVIEPMQTSSGELVAHRLLLRASGYGATPGAAWNAFDDAAARLADALRSL